MIDLTDKKIGRLTVLFRAKSGRRSKWFCICDCGTEKIILQQSLLNGNSTSCGCYRIERQKASVTKHGMSGTSTHSIWNQMKRRCYKKNHPEYFRYGARGIRVCEEWHDFKNFYRDMGTRPKNRSLDRIDNNGNYSKSNCRWATIKQQNDNKRPRYSSTPRPV